MNEVHDFIRDNRSLIIVLDDLKPVIVENTSYAWRYLKLEYDPCFPTQMLLVLKAFSWDFANGFKKDINEILKFADSLMKKLNLSVELFIWDCSFYEDIHCLGVLKPLYSYFSTDPAFDYNYF